MAREAASATAGRTNNTLRLRDGRQLGYAEFGDPNGKPLFFLHGFPNSRLGPAFAHEDARRRGIRVIAFERPGFGRSDFKRDRTIGDWPDDVVEAADVLGIERFAVLGASGGGPYAAACAAKIPHRLTATGIVSGLGPLDVPASAAGFRRWDRFVLSLARRFPLLIWMVMSFVALGIRLFPRLLIWLMSRSLPAPDKAILARPEIKASVRDDIREAFRQGARAAVYEAQLYLRPWDFRPEEISIDVQLWHGEADATVPVSMGRYLAQAIPNCRATFYPGEGHLMAVDRMDEIHTALLR